MVEMNATPLSIADAQRSIALASSKHSSLQSKLDTIKKNIQVQEDALHIDSTSIENDDTIKYYKTQIDDTKKRKDAALEKLENDYIARKSALEIEFQNRRDAIDTKFDSQVNMFIGNIDTKREKLQNKTPTSPAYKRLIAELAIVEAQTNEANNAYIQAIGQMERAQINYSEKMRQQYMAEERQRQFNESLKEEEERKRIEQQRENTRREEMKRAEERSRAAKHNHSTVIVDSPTTLQYSVTPPTKAKKAVKSTVKPLSLLALDAKKQYTVAQLDTVEVDFEEHEAESELWEKLRHEAAVREGVFGAFVCKDDEQPTMRG